MVPSPAVKWPARDTLRCAIGRDRHHNALARESLQQQRQRWPGARADRPPHKAAGTQIGLARLRLLLTTLWLAAGANCWTKWSMMTTTTAAQDSLFPEIRAGTDRAALAGFGGLWLLARSFLHPWSFGREKFLGTGGYSAHPVSVTLAASPSSRPWVVSNEIDMIDLRYEMISILLSSLLFDMVRYH